MTFIKKISSLLIISVAVFGLAACSDDKAETTGEKVDEMVHDAGEAAENAGDNVGDMVDDAGNALEEAGEKASDMATDAGNALEDACEKAKEKVNAEDKDC
ncbi:iron-containing alcohol dehydrogenase [Colwellia sp. M166]|nr:hypothetical protein [Colwellia sp. M166]UUO23717.1 iron-containing alcohol dehydrogenase [Colwellia sp. M166]|tara:strand:- start:26948 stop:27250 length:303 start_codon:yes stop_codon:yes gene_type:complete